MQQEQINTDYFIIFDIIFAICRYIAVFYVFIKVIYNRLFYQRKLYLQNLSGFLYG